MIERLTIEQKRLSAAEAELWVIVQPSTLAGALIRGSLIGPSCANVKTIQIAYPLKPIRPTSDGDGVLVGRVLIPEPNLWTEETPYIYQGQVELVVDGKVADCKPIRAAFKASA